MLEAKYREITLGNVTTALCVSLGNMCEWSGRGNAHYSFYVALKLNKACHRTFTNLHYFMVWCAQENSLLSKHNNS